MRMLRTGLIVATLMAAWGGLSATLALPISKTLSAMSVTQKVRLACDSYGRCHRSHYRAYRRYAAYRYSHYYGGYSDYCYAPRYSNGAPTYTYGYAYGSYYRIPGISYGFWSAP